MTENERDMRQFSMGLETVINRRQDDVPVAGRQEGEEDEDTTDDGDQDHDEVCSG